MNLRQQIFEAGIVGAGGAGFPTYKKLVSDAHVDLLVVNGVECEPLLASDRYLMRHHAAAIVAGARAMAEACGAARIVIGTKSHYTSEIAALERAIEEAGAPIGIHGLDSFYPAGDEQVLVFEITGRTVLPGGLPLDLGVVTINVATAAHIAQAVESIPVTRRFVTVTGEVAHPVIVDAPIGARAADLIEAAGGAVSDPYVIVRGGPMMGRHHPMSEAGKVGYGKADGGLIVLPGDHPLVEFVSKPVERLVGETQSMCIQCQMCTSLCPRYLIGHQMRPHRVMRSLQNGSDEGLADALLCCECGVCELYSCPMGLSPRRMNVYVKGLLRARGVGIADHAVYPEHQVDRRHRRIPQSRLIERLQLGGYPVGIDDMVRLDPGEVRIPTRHGVGGPASVQVEIGERVSAGQLIAGVEWGAVGAPVHASIDGVVTQADAAHITIARDPVAGADETTEQGSSR